MRALPSVNWLGIVLLIAVVLSVLGVGALAWIRVIGFIARCWR